MFSALLYLQFHSLKNRTLARLKRLRQPKYLLGGMVGGLYFYFYFIRSFFGMPGRHHGGALEISAENRLLFELGGALILLLFVLAAWLLPHERAALAFTEAEVAFLFPAPISRRGLLHFKLLRSQVAIFFTTFFLMLVTNRFGGKGWIHVIGWWVVLSTINLHLLGCSFARTRLLDRGLTNWQRRWAILGGIALGAGAVALWARQTMPTLDLGGAPNASALREYAYHCFTAGPMPYLLYPFRLVVRPYFAPDLPGLALALGPALLLLVLHYLWVIRSNVAFEEASVEASRRLAEKVAAVRAGNWQGARKPTKSKRPPFVLGSTGVPAIALLWKNLISAGQVFTARLWILVLAVGTGTAVALSQNAGGGMSMFVGMLAGIFLAWSLLLGPQVLRQDLRQDLPLMDVLKTYPLRGWEIVLGELLAPALVLTCLQWFLLLVAALLLPGVPGMNASPALVRAIAVGVGLMVPTLNLLTLQIPNAAVLMFPAWFQVGREGAQGIEATGQRIIFMLGQLLVLSLALVPAAIVFTVVFFVFKLLLSGPVLAIPLAAAAGSTALGAEAALGLILLGELFRRFDLSAEGPG